jgi:osmotically-inducible protein OsmY
MKKMAVVLTWMCLAVAGVAMANANPDLEQQISAKLVEAFGEDGESIRVTVADGKAVLIGKVAERSTQELAEEVALFFEDIRSVDNQVEAAKDKTFLEGSLLGEGEDAKVEISVKAALQGEIGKYANRIEVEAAEGVVAIRGTVPDEARLNFAREAAAKVHGVRKLIDLLRVKE